MKSYKLIHQLLDLLEKQEQENNGNEVSIRDFAGYLVSSLGDKTKDVSSPDVRFGTNEIQAQEQAYQLDNNIGRLFVYMSRYAKSYIKKALEGTPLQTAEDFTALTILFTHDDLSKSDLISRNLQEKTSGTEVIRRLISAGLVRQWDDETDKRGKRVAITDNGKALLFVVFKDMNNVGRMITGTLSVSEKLTLQYLLNKLESFHHYHYEHRSVVNKEDLKLTAEAIKI